MWELRAKHCPLCGAPLVPGDVEGRVRARCQRCVFVLYAHPGAAAAAVVLDEQGRVLLVRRAIDPCKGCWAFPAGYQECDEAPAAAAVREVREEAGLEVDVIGLIDLVFVADDPRRPANVAIFACRVTGGRACAGDDVCEVAWFELDRLPPDIGFENNREILDRLRRQGGYAHPLRSGATGPPDGSGGTGVGRDPSRDT